MSHNNTVKRQYMLVRMEGVDRPVPTFWTYNHDARPVLHVSRWAAEAGLNGGETVEAVERHGDRYVFPRLRRQYTLADLQRFAGRVA